MSRATDLLWSFEMLALAALILLILEVALTRWIAIQRRTGKEGQVEFEENAHSTAQFREQLAQMKQLEKTGASETTRMED